MGGGRAGATPAASPVDCTRLLAAVAVVAGLAFLGGILGRTVGGGPAGQPAGSHQGVRRADPLLDLLPSLVIGVFVHGEGDPAVASEPVAGGVDLGVDGDDGGRLVLGQLEAEKLGLDITEDEVPIVDPEGGVVAPLFDIDPLGLGQPTDDPLQAVHVVHHVGSLPGTCSDTSRVAP